MQLLLLSLTLLQRVFMANIANENDTLRIAASKVLSAVGMTLR